jgi:hypothetical protein
MGLRPPLPVTGIGLLLLLLITLCYVSNKASCGSVYFEGAQFLLNDEQFKNIIRDLQFTRR